MITALVMAIEIYQFDLLPLADAAGPGVGESERGVNTANLPHPESTASGSRPGWGRARFAAAAAVALLAAAGCGASGDRGAKPAAPPDSALAQQCPSPPPGTRRVTLPTPDGQRLGAAEVGATSAALGVVISQGASSTICDWLPTAVDLAAKGARVLVVDRRGTGSSPGPPDLLREPADVVTAGRWLTRTGAKKLLLVGSSMGTVSAFVAASPTGPSDAVTPRDPTAPTFAKPPCGVALISPLVSIGGPGGTVDSLAVRRWPTRLWVAYEVGHASIAADANQVAERAEATGGTVVHRLGIQGKDHSLQLLRRHAEARGLLGEAVAAC